MKLVRASGARGTGRVEEGSVVRSLPGPTPPAGTAADATTNAANPAPHLEQAGLAAAAASASAVPLRVNDIPTGRARCGSEIQQRGTGARTVSRERDVFDYCGADGGEHEWVVAYWIGGEHDECGEHTYCRKCHEEYLE